MDPFSYALLLPVFGMSRANTTTTFDELTMHNDTNMRHWWRMVCVYVCVRALHRYFISAEVACLWCRPWVSPIQIINLSAVTRPRPTSKRTAPLLHFSSLRSEGRNVRWWHSIDFNTLSSFLWFPYSSFGKRQLPLVNSLESDAILILQQAPTEALDVLVQKHGLSQTGRFPWCWDNFNEWQYTYSADISALHVVTLQFLTPYTLVLTLHTTMSDKVFSFNIIPTTKWGDSSTQNQQTDLCSGDREFTSRYELHV